MFASSSLLLGTLSALLLNVVFRIGVKRTVTLSVEPGQADPESIEQFLRAQGAAWGARPDVVGRAVFAANQLVETVTENTWKSGPLNLQASFDEFNLDLRLSKFFTLGRYRYEFIAQLFNVANRANFNTPISNPASPTFGTVNQLLPNINAPSRQAEFAIRIQF